jgi:tripartite-type tricarboxylate transporter receptor subunit TctC
MGSAGVGNPDHVAGEFFKMWTGIDMLHVPYKGTAPVVVDLLGGQVQVPFDPHISGSERTHSITSWAVTRSVPSRSCRARSNRCGRRRLLSRLH